MQERSTKNGKMAYPSSSVSQSSKKEMSPVVAFVVKSVNDWVFTNAGTLAYDMVMLMVPIAFSMLILLKLFGLSGAIPQIVQRISLFFPALSGQQNALTVASNQAAQDTPLLLTLSIIAALFFGALLFMLAEGFLDVIYRVRPRPLLRQFLVALGMFVLFIILIPVLALASNLPMIAISQLGSQPVWGYVGDIIGGLVASFIFYEVCYLVIPNQKLNWRCTWCGALVAAVTTEIFLLIYPLFVSIFFNTYFGPIGVAAVLLLFLYILAALLLVGGEVNAFFFEHVRPLPNDLTTFVSTMAGRLNNDMPALEGAIHMDSTPTEQADDARIAESYREAQFKKAL